MLVTEFGWHTWRNDLGEEFASNPSHQIRAARLTAPYTDWPWQMAAHWDPFAPAAPDWTAFFSWETPREIVVQFHRAVGAMFADHGRLDDREPAGEARFHSALAVRLAAGWQYRADGDSHTCTSPDGVAKVSFHGDAEDPASPRLRLEHRRCRPHLAVGGTAGRADPDRTHPRHGRSPRRPRASAPRALAPARRPRNGGHGDAAADASSCPHPRPAAAVGGTTHTVRATQAMRIPRAQTPSTPEPASRERFVISAYFAVAGFVLAVWGASLPAVQHRLQLGVGELSIALTCTAVGMAAGLQTAGRYGDRAGAHRLLRPAALALLAALAVLGLASGLPVFLVACTTLGFFHGNLDIAMNVSAVRCQQAYGRPIMQSIHASYSLGALAGALAAALASSTGMGPTITFCTVAEITAATVFLLPRLDTDPSPQPGGQPKPSPVASRRLPRQLVMLSAIAAASLLGEGAAADWASVQMHTTAHADSSTAAAAYACYSAAMALGRFNGDRLTRAIGPVPLVRGGGLLAAAGLCTTLLLPTSSAGLLGWALFGAGLACVVPAAVTAAARVRPERAGQDIAWVSTAGYLGMVAGPAAIGALASSTTLTAALTLPAALALAITAAAGSTRPPHVETP